MAYYNWQKPKKADYVKFRKASPNLVGLCDWLIKRWGGTKVGLYQRRPVRGGEVPSSHTFGAAVDWRYRLRKDAEEVMKVLVRHHDKLGVQVIIDYVGCRQWIVGSGWKPLKPSKVKGFGESWAKWLHIETTRKAWNNKTPIENR
jgi:hypothetical protein